jgi:hypothetical protein
MRRLTPVLVATVFLTARGAAHADLVCAEPVVDKGDVRSGNPLGQRFLLVNRGGGEVEVTEVKPGCGCLVPRLEKRRLGPGEQGVLELTVNTLTAATGPQNWRVELSYQSDGRPQGLELLVRANVIPEITVEPTALVVFTNGPIRRDVTLVERRPQPLALTGVRTTSPHLRARAGEPSRDEAGHWSRTIALEVLADFPEGRHEEALTIATADPTFGEWKVPVTMVKRARKSVNVAPEAVTFTGTPGEAPPARLVRISGHGDQEVVVDRVEAGDPAVQCQWAQGPGPQVTLKVRIDSSRAAVGLKSEVRVYLRQPSELTVTIPVTWAGK